MQTIAIINQKGGVGKSTTAAALIAGLKKKGFKVLGVDLDGQCSLSLITGTQGEKTSLDIMDGAASAEEAIIETSFGDIIPAETDLYEAQTRYVKTGKEYKLKEALQPLQDKYDYCVIDTPPALGVLTLNALTAADFALIPALADIMSLQGIMQLKDTIGAVKKYLNSGLNIAGILLTMYNSRATLDKEITELMQRAAAALDTKVFRSTIRSAAAVKKSQATQTDIYTYAPKENVTADYETFLNELLEVTNNGR